ncbi:hypothetical protein GGX14DRAFT_573135 [Mycena pura]|uniref:Uncharacterized protein n=1 Tax=Mycena pura TaxID=153505 RepID=A0AAD6UZN5_9AGAR|nr:hypothetical protein GGX14DRAFT_573135 [Mycena pura]
MARLKHSPRLSNAAEIKSQHVFPHPAFALHILAALALPLHSSLPAQLAALHEAPALNLPATSNNEDEEFAPLDTLHARPRTRFRETAAARGSSAGAGPSNTNAGNSSDPPRSHTPPVPLNPASLFDSPNSCSFVPPTTPARAAAHHFAQRTHDVQSMATPGPQTRNLRDDAGAWSDGDVSDDDFAPIQETSVPAERVFSSSAQTDTKRRNHIGPVLMEALQMLKFTFKKARLDFMEEFRAAPECESEEDFLRILAAAVDEEKREATRREIREDTDLVDGRYFDMPEDETR